MGSVQHLHLADLNDEDVEPAAVIAAAVEGDLAAFENLYRRFAPRLYGLCLRLTGQREAAEDCVQESFVAAWRGLGRFGADQRIYDRACSRGVGGGAMEGHRVGAAVSQRLPGKRRGDSGDLHRG